MITSYFSKFTLGDIFSKWTNDYISINQVIDLANIQS